MICDGQTPSKEKRYLPERNFCGKTYAKDDVFSPNWTAPKFDKSAPDYGRPKKGSLTEKRGIEAGKHICKEILCLCEIIAEHGRLQSDGTCIIEFGQLFRIYTRISDKVVGMLLRARRHKMVQFQGEMLYQGQDERTVVTLLKSLSEVKLFYEATDDPAHCVKRDQ